MQRPGPELTALIGSRICHDLISPLGAIGNGLELLAMSIPASGPEMSLISESLDSAKARIRFFRVAFGAAGDGQMVGDTEIRSILRDAGGGRISFDWQAQGDQPRGEVKLVFLLLLCFETAMPRGGLVTVTALGGEWAVRGDADGIRIDPDLWQLLPVPGDLPDLPAAQVQFALAPIAARGLGRRLTVESGEGSARVRF